MENILKYAQLWCNICTLWFFIRILILKAHITYSHLIKYIFQSACKVLKILIYLDNTVYFKKLEVYMSKLNLGVTAYFRWITSTRKPLLRSNMMNRWSAVATEGQQRQQQQLFLCNATFILDDSPHGEAEFKSLYMKWVDSWASVRATTVQHLIDNFKIRHYNSTSNRSIMCVLKHTENEQRCGFTWCNACYWYLYWVLIFWKLVNSTAKEAVNLQFSFSCNSL